MSKRNMMSFSYVEPCVSHWEKNRGIRKSALRHQQLVKDADGKSLISPSLRNLRCNYHLLKGFTQHMANEGVILTKRVAFTKPPVAAFYELMEVDTTTDSATAVVHGTAVCIKRMLTLVKSKWRKWELPRVPGFDKFVVFSCASYFCMFGPCKNMFG